MSLDRRECLMAFAAAPVLPATARPLPWRAGVAAADITPPRDRR
jgi:hypothetical protein